jgi:hypothetical protein
MGWGITGLILLVALQRIVPRPASNFKFALSVYLVNFALPLGFCILNGFWLAVFAGMAVVFGALILVGGLWRAFAFHRGSFPNASAQGSAQVTLRSPRG